MTINKSIIEAFCANNEFFVWDAVVAWRDSIYQTDFYNSSKGNYITSMLKLIESGIVNIRLKLVQVDEHWLNESKLKIDENSEWAKSTKTVRKSCLNSFYSYTKKDFNTTLTPYRRHPDSTDIEYILSPKATCTKEQLEKLERAVLKHVFSNVPDKVRVRDVCPIVLCNALSKINERDAYIVWLMMHTGQPLEKVLDCRKEHLRFTYMDPEEAGRDDKKLAYCGYLDFDNNSQSIPGNIIDEINEVCKNSILYLFETTAGKRVTRTQVTRNLKQAGRNIGLDYDLTPKILHGYVCAYMGEDKRSQLEKGLGIFIR